MSDLRMYTNWEILAEMVRRPRRYWRDYRDCRRSPFNGYWFRP